MANQKSKYKEVLYTRVTPANKVWADKQVPGKYPSLSALVDALITKEKALKKVV